MSTRGPVFFWDLTVSKEKASREAVKEWCKTNCKQWVFQEEIGAETGYAHYQCRVNLVEKARRPGVPKEWCANWSATSVNVVKGKRTFQYVIKSETRVAGPWSDRDEAGYLPRDVPENLLDWQHELLQRLEEQNGRQILFMADPEGGTGKTTLLRYMASRGAVVVPPYCDTPQQMAGFFYAAASQDPSKVMNVIFDIPRSLTYKIWQKVAITVEAIKDGWASDGRMSARFMMCEKPKVLVCYNSLPGDLTLEHLFSHDKIARFEA